MQLNGETKRKIKSLGATALNTKLDSPGLPHYTQDTTCLVDCTRRTDVSVYLTPSSGRTYALIAENHLAVSQFLSVIQWRHHKIYQTQRRLIYNNFYSGYCKLDKVVNFIFYDATTVPKTIAAKQQVVSSTEHLSSP